MLDEPVETTPADLPNWLNQVSVIRERVGRTYEMLLVVRAKLPGIEFTGPNNQRILIPWMYVLPLISAIASMADERLKEQQ